MAKAYNTTFFALFIAVEDDDGNRNHDDDDDDDEVDDLYIIGAVCLSRFCLFHFLPFLDTWI